MERNLTKKEISNLKLPEKAGDKINTTRFHEGLEGWEGTVTVKGFYVSKKDNKFSPVYSKLSRLLKNKSCNTSVIKNILIPNIDITEDNNDAIMVLIKETRGSVMLRYCIKE